MRKVAATMLQHTSPVVAQESAEFEMNDDSELCDLRILQRQGRFVDWLVGKSIILLVILTLAKHGYARTPTSKMRAYLNSHFAESMRWLSQSIVPRTDSRPRIGKLTSQSFRALIPDHASLSSQVLWIRSIPYTKQKVWQRITRDQSDTASMSPQKADRMKRLIANLLVFPLARLQRL